MQKGKFITFEGLDGSGKSTQLDLTKNWLRDKGFSVLISREPGGTKIGDEIRNILLNPRHKNLNPESELLLYLADRMQNLSESVIPAKSQGKIVLCDRSHDSTIAYQGYGRELNLDVFETFFSQYVNPQKPDFTILLNISPETVFKRLKERKDKLKSDRLDLESLRFFERVSRGFEDIASLEKERIICINGEQKKENIHKEIVEVLKQKLEMN